MSNKRHTIKAAKAEAARAPERRQEQVSQQSHLGDRFLRQSHVHDEYCDRDCEE